MELFTSLLPEIVLFDLAALEDSLRLFGIKLIDTADLTEVALRFGFNLVVLYLIVSRLYFRSSRRSDYLFTLYMFGIVVFFICLLLANVKLQLGFALGLFAIFSLLRYRTDPIPIKEMTYMLIVVGIAVINSLSSRKVSYMEMAFTNAAIIAATWVLEKMWFRKREQVQFIRYEKIDLIKPDKYNELIKDLRERTGLNIHRFEIERINFMTDTARIKVYFYEKNNDKKT